ncbi:uncharacterized protein LOC136079180 [Hydra vulgaris]|uniref:Uncharacterized protein LOC136079180 n=1 Tax=Hydra vulgaris TaxID=6087 RepID=A0ABM4BPD9_HYDVU
MNQNLSTRVINLSSSLPLGNSSQGHRILSWDYVALSKNETTFSNKKYDFNKGDYINFGKKIMETNWKQLFENKNTNECYELFCNKYNKLSKQFIPLKKVHTTRNAPWMNKEVLAMIKQKKQLGNYLSATNWRSATLIREYRKLRSQVQKACKRRVRVFEAQLASDKRNPKRVYAYAKAQQNVHVSISAISNAKRETLTEGIHIANRLNEHFKSVFVDDSKSSQLPIFERRHYQEDLGDITINFEATLAYLKGEHSSDWTDVLSGVPQGSVLGPTLFIIYVNDLKDKLKSVHKIYADDTKLLQEIRPEFHDADCLILQNDLNIVTEWSKEWLMELNVQKCKVMHLGYGNSNHEYVMNDGNASLTLEATDIERDLGILNHRKGQHH